MIVWSVFVTLLTAMGLVAATVRSPGTIRKNPIFLLLAWEVWIYVHLAPTICIFGVSETLWAPYLQAQCAALALFEIPLWLLYFRLWRFVGGQPDGRMMFLSKGVLVFMPTMLIFGMGFAYAMSQGDLWFKSIGHEALAQKYRELPVAIWAIFRTWEKVGAAFVALYAACVVLARPPGGKLLTFGAMLVSCGAYLRYAVTNSRLETLILILLIAVTVMHARRHASFWREIKMSNQVQLAEPVLPRRRPRWIFLLAALFFGGVLCVYSMRVVKNARAEFLDSGHVQARWFNPFYAPAVEVGSEWYWRLNGIDLIAQTIQVKASDPDRIGWFRPWGYILEINSSPKKLADAKEEMRTTAKGFMLREYLRSDLVDYYGCALTDVFGNAGFLGFPFIAFSFAVACAWVDSRLAAPRGALSLIVALTITVNLLRFEHDFSAVIMETAKTLIVTTPLIFICPVQVRRWINPYRSIEVDGIPGRASG